MNVYRSEQVHYVSNPKRGKPYGVRNTVVIEGGRAYKEHADLNKQGKVTHTKKHRLTKEEQQSILGRTFVPTLWHCCNKTRKRSRRQL